MDIDFTSLPLAGVTFLGADIWRGIREADIIGKVSLIACATLSVISWAIIIYKWLQLRRVNSQTEAFVDEVLESKGSIEEAYRASVDYSDSPLAEILREAVVELEVEGWFREGYNLKLEDRLHLAQNSVDRVVERTISSETRHLESHLIFLATTASVSPFIGLFGTVWGVLGAFQALGISSSGAVATLGPGISTALVATVAGLFAAIPAQLFYNWFIARVAHATHRMDAFALELANIIQRRIARDG
jgi:biopolymer transport protein TolQ